MIDTTTNDTIITKQQAQKATSSGQTNNSFDTVDGTPTIANFEQVMRFMEAAAEEVIVAQAKHPPLNSLHEAYAVIREEFDEFWEQVKLQSGSRDPQAIIKELLQVAAMCCRTVIDCGLPMPQPQPSTTTSRATNEVSNTTQMNENEKV